MQALLNLLLDGEVIADAAQENSLLTDEVKCWKQRII